MILMMKIMILMRTFMMITITIDDHVYDCHDDIDDDDDDDD